MERVVAPTRIEKVRSLVRDSHGPISIGGARRLDRVLELDVEGR